MRSSIRRLERQPEDQLHPGLTRFRRVLKTLGNPEQALQVVHVAGTNGKGSVCALLESVLRQAGYRVGLYTSPHLIRLEERIQINRASISTTHLDQTLSHVFQAERRAGTALSYFERITAAAFLYFKSQHPDVVILETGMGGRWDATNVLPHPLACVITPIALDHTRWLGNTLSKIADEKAGIFKMGTPVLTTATAPAALRVLHQAAQHQRTVLWSSPRDFEGTAESVNWKKGEMRVSIRSHAASWRDFAISMMGRHQAQNASLAVSALEALRPFFPWTNNDLRIGLHQAKWPGRWELLARFAGRKVLYADGAHNPQGIEALIQTLESSPWSRSQRTLWFTCFEDKDIDSMARRLAVVFSRVVIQSMRGNRFASIIRIRRAFQKAGSPIQIYTTESIAEGKRQAVEITSAPGAVIAAGSLRWVGILKEHLQ